jgi:hypothetical protein
MNERPSILDRYLAFGFSSAERVLQVSVEKDLKCVFKESRGNLPLESATGWKQNSYFNSACLQ